MAKPMHLKRCYYETLEVDSDANDDDLKKAYRQQALKWHPDKNPEDVEMAAIRFKEVQSAYDCLSDPRERAWYDKHRDHILRGSDRDGIDDSSSFDLLPFFLSSSYSGYGDDELSFYTVYKKVFDEIIKEETMYLNDDEDVNQFPRFGTRLTDYSDVHTFYSFWSAYNTRKTYLNLMKYDTREAENRREARAMEKENNKLREVKRKNRNNEIRSLVAFIKRRDKRVLERKKKMTDEIEEKRKRTKEHQKKQLKQKKEQLFRDSFTESEWTSMVHLESSLAKLEQDLSKMELKSKKRNGLEPDADDGNGETDENVDENLIGDEVTDGATGFTTGLNDDDDNGGDTSDADGLDTDTTEELLCLACHKSFKSVKSFENHEKSKKHKSNLSKLKQEMAADDQLLQ